MLRKGSGRPLSRCYVFVAQLEVHIAHLGLRPKREEKQREITKVGPDPRSQSAFTQSAQCGSQLVTQAGLGSLLVIDWSTQRRRGEPSASFARRCPMSDRSLQSIVLRTPA